MAAKRQRRLCAINRRPWLGEWRKDLFLAAERSRAIAHTLMRFKSSMLGRAAYTNRGIPLWGPRHEERTPLAILDGNRALVGHAAVSPGVSPAAIVDPVADLAAGDKTALDA